MKALYLSTLLCLFTIAILNGQAFQRIADINPGPGNSVFREYNVAIEFNGKLLFTANDGAHGYEVWVYDGNEATLLKDIFSGPGHANAQNYFLLDDKVIFTARDSAHGVEWWSTDGTSEGTLLLKDIFPGTAGGVFTGVNNRAYFLLFNGEVYFTGAHRSNDYELWKTDGTSAGTVLVKNIVPDGFGNFSSFPEDYAEHNGSLYFACSEGLWKTNGTSSGTVLVEDEDPEDVFGLKPNDLMSNGDYLIFIQNSDLWRSDGTAAGTVKIKDLNYVNLNWFGNRFTRLGNILLFPGADPVNGEELWRTDGTSAGTHIVIDLDPGDDGYAPQNNIAFKGKMYYKGDDGSKGIEFWSSDGTAAGTELVKDIYPGFISGFSLPTEIYTDGEYMYLTGDSFEEELWISDGTPEGTYEVDINPDDDSQPSKFYGFDNKLFFFAYSEESGVEPYILDPTLTATDDVLENSRIQLYPNPTFGTLYILTEESAEVTHTVLDIHGRMLINKLKGNSIDMSDAPAGFYFLQTQLDNTGEIISNRRFVVIR